ncbi:MAG TPA: DUF4142 domain-containing protein [Burkholderiaceae bacterium]|nr:DUF4142 domain-containing protein [Burkholderiaceae bacterium]
MDPNKGLWLLLAVAITTVLLSPTQRGSDAPSHAAPGASGAPSAAAPASAMRPVNTATDGRTIHVTPLESRMVSVSSLDNASSRLASHEREFIAAAAVTMAYEARMAELASRQASDPQIGEYAAELKANRWAFRDELAAFIETRDGPPLPGELTRDQQKRLDALGRAVGQEFDRRFVQSVGAGEQQGTVRLFEAASRSVRNPTLKAWVDKTLPALRTQLAQAEALRKPVIARSDGPPKVALR